MMRHLLFAFLLTIALTARPLSAASPDGRAPVPRKPDAATPAVCPADDSAVRPGMRAFIDSQTGQLREPTAEEAQELARAAREEFLQRLESLEEVVHEDGMISLDLKGLFQQNLVVVRGPDGSLSMQCLPYEGTGSPAMAVPAPAPPKPARPLEVR
jgi:hypothetical protein